MHRSGSRCDRTRGTKRLRSSLLKAPTGLKVASHLWTCGLHLPEATLLTVPFIAIQTRGLLQSGGVGWGGRATNPGTSESSPPEARQAPLPGRLGGLSVPFLSMVRRPEACWERGSFAVADAGPTCPGNAPSSPARLPWTSSAAGRRSSAAASCRRSCRCSSYPCLSLGREGGQLLPAAPGQAVCRPSGVGDRGGERGSRGTPGCVAPGMAPARPPCLRVLLIPDSCRAARPPWAVRPASAGTRPAGPVLAPGVGRQ